MKSNKLLYILLVIVVIAQLWIPAKMILDQQKTIDEGFTHQFRIEPIDPNDPFRGKYLIINYEDDSFEVDTSEIWEQKQPVYLTFTIDSLGFSVIKEVLKEKPDSITNYLSTKINWISNYETKELHINYPFKRYYLNEVKAPKAESIYVESTNDSTSLCWATVIIKEGNAVLIDVLIDSVSILELVK